MTKQVTSVDGKTLVSAAHEWEEFADWELLTRKVRRGCRIVWHMALGPLTPVIGRSHSLVFWLRPVTVEKTASEMVFTSLRAMPQVTQCCHPNSEMLQCVWAKDNAWRSFARLCVAAGWSGWLNGLMERKGIIVIYTYLLNLTGWCFIYSHAYREVRVTT